MTVPTDASGALLGAVACYDEYGNQTTDQNGDADGNPVDTSTRLNTGALSYGWLGAKQRSADGSGLVLMGVRLYNSVTGQFTSMDPVPGGNSTAYAYPQDPINQFDVSGQWGVRKWWHRHWKAVAIGVAIAALFVLAPEALPAVAAFAEDADAAFMIVRAASTAVGDDGGAMASERAIGWAGRVWTRGGRAIRSNHGTGPKIGLKSRGASRIYRSPQLKNYKGRFPSGRVANFEKRGISNYHVRALE
ncbi:RHS repeat-associated core domain-containing protein [Cellulomonas alba]|uniref:RHS repeat-associated core domain-containing protein n=1 Tax=Cellulomonas alba TaxID=3053467 RepID=A0ABT7SAT9_9CELL|nr:RHS repeat-associated core domain-containing protein [Cellulomonas alba]MDM7853303.1 RHS repeat-associated core domain-containing protein [Cellulomonas alba]